MIKSKNELVVLPMLDIKENRRSQKVLTGRDDQPCAVDIRTAAFPIQSQALFRLETIPTPQFWSKDWSKCACLSIGDNLFPVASRGWR